MSDTVDIQLITPSGHQLAPVTQFGLTVLNTDNAEELSELIGSSSSSFTRAPAGWDTVWAEAKTSSSTTPAWLSIIGDSIATGAISGTAWYENGWISKLRNALCGTDLDTLHKEYFPAIQRNSVTAVGTAADQPWSDASLTYTPNFIETVGWHPMEWFSSTGVGIQTFTAPYACANAVLHVWSQYSSWGYKINGGATVTHTHSGPSYVLQSLSLGPLTAGDTVQWGFQGATQAGILGGITLEKSATGIGVGRLVAGGSRLTSIAGSGQTHYPGGIEPLWAGKNPQNAALIDSATNFTFGFPTQPHLAVIALGVNDCASSTSAANYASVLDQSIAGLRRGRENCSVCLVIYDYPNQDYSDATSRINTPAAPSVSVQGTPGATAYKVRFGYYSAYGGCIPGPATDIANGPAVINGTDFLRVTMPVVPNALGYRIFISADAGSTWNLTAPTVAQVPGGVYDAQSLGTPSAMDSVDSSGLAFYLNWHGFVAAIYEAADKWGCAVVNMGAKWGATPKAQGFMNLDIHPTLAGHNDIFEQVNALVNP